MQNSSFLAPHRSRLGSGMRECSQVGDCPAGGDPEARATQLRALLISIGAVLAAAFKKIKNRGNELKDLLQRQGITEIANSKRTHFRAEKAAVGAERSGISRIVGGRLAVPWPRRSRAIRGRAGLPPHECPKGINIISRRCCHAQPGPGTIMRSTRHLRRDIMTVRPTTRRGASERNPAVSPAALASRR